MTEVLTKLDYPAPSIKIPFLLVYYIAVLMGLIATLISPIVKWRPRITKFSVALIGTHHYYSCERAKRELGYRPRVSMDEGLKETLKYFEQSRNKK